MKVSWMISAERNDPFLQQNPDDRQVEIVKSGGAQGKYLMPQLYGQPAESGIYYKQSKTLAPVVQQQNAAPAVKTGKK